MALSLCSAATHCICRSLAQRPASVLLVQFVSDALVGEADKLGERRVWAAGTARQRWDETADRGPGVTIEGPQIDRLRRAAGRRAHPKEPLSCLERAADRWREQHRHAFALPYIPCRHQTACILEHLCSGSALGGRFLLSGCGALRFHLALIEAMARIFAERDAPDKRPMDSRVTGPMLSSDVSSA
jgi:hypothetical protein